MRKKEKQKKANIFSDWSHKNKYVFFPPHFSWEAALLLAKRQAMIYPESPCKCWAGPRTECHLFEHRGGLSVPGWIFSWAAGKPPSSEPCHQLQNLLLCPAFAVTCSGWGDGGCYLSFCVTTTYFPFFFVIFCVWELYIYSSMIFLI